MKAIRLVVVVATGLSVASAGVIPGPVAAEAVSVQAGSPAVSASDGPKTLALPTFTMTSRMKRAYRKAGGVAKLGVPRTNTNCRLPEGGCLQRYSKGVLYLQRNGRYFTTAARGTKGEILAVAKSQVGFKQSYAGGIRRMTKYGKYAKAPHPGNWCGTFQSWVAYASGHPTLLTRSWSFTAYKRYLGSHFTRRAKPVSGAYVLMRGSEGVRSHTGVVVSVNRDRTMTVIHGNTGGHKVKMARMKVAKDMRFYYPY